MKRVLLINWDNYPNVSSGGVYTWEKTFVEGMQDSEFVVLNQLSNTNASGIYSVPKNVREVIEVPIFGTNRYEEFSRQDDSLVSKILRTTDAVVRRKFQPLLGEFLKNILADTCEPEQVKNSIFKLHKFLTFYDAKKCFEHPIAWETFLKQISTDPLYSQMELKEALDAFQFFQRGLQVISIEIPRVDLVHCSLAWLPSMVAVCAKKEYNAPIVLTEHGVAYKEQLLNYNTLMHDESSKMFWKTLARNIITTVYSEADAIVPVCVSNSVWERMLGAEESKISVIYNGIDTKKFRPMETSRTNERPTIVSVARIDVYKDITTLIQAVNYVREVVPQIECLMFGASIDLEYSLKCANLVKTLHLENNFKFMGGTKEPEKAYNRGDIVAFSGITEGFPFSVIEAMACGKAVVAADVGGVSEALDGCGILVRSRSPQDLANGIIELVENKRLRDELGTAACKRARERFSLETSIDQYRKLYNSLIALPAKEIRKQRPAEIVVKR